MKTKSVARFFKNHKKNLFFVSVFLDFVGKVGFDFVDAENSFR